MSSTIQASAAPSAHPSPGGTARFYVPALDGLRTVAFLMVWWTHALASDAGSGIVPKDWFLAFKHAGAYGVPVFFVLSTFLITRLLLTERERTGGIDLRAYYVRRSLRIWPLYFLVVVLAILQWSHGRNLPAGAVLSLATFTANWYQAFTRPFENFSTVLWSVSVEEQFYLVWPLILARLSPDTLKRLCYAMIAAALGFRVFAAFQCYDSVSVWFLTTTHLDALALGTLLALWGLPPLPKAGVGWALAFVGCLVAFVVQTRIFSGDRYDVTMALGGMFVPLVAAIMVGLALRAKKGFLAHPWTVHLGRLTYGMYCYHMLVLQFVHVRDALHLAGALAATYVLAWVSYHFYEKRFLKLKHRFERVPSRPD